MRGQGEKYPWELSGGMQQRTSLCRALIHEPQLLMLDEPFAALDAFTREELWCVIRDLHAARKITVCLVTHDLREAVFLADRVFVMSARPGRILVERKIELPRPRDLDVTFTQGFQDIVHELRVAHREGAAMNRERPHGPAGAVALHRRAVHHLGGGGPDVQHSDVLPAAADRDRRRPSSNTGRRSTEIRCTRCRPR